MSGEGERVIEEGNEDGWREGGGRGREGGREGGREREGRQGFSPLRSTL